jgi:hypothetical protein
MGASQPRIDGDAERLVQAARDLGERALEPDCWQFTPAIMGGLAETMSVLSSSCNALAANAAPTISRRMRHGSIPGPVPPAAGLTREAEMRLIANLHDAAAALSACGRALRGHASVVEPLITRRIEAQRESTQRSGDRERATDDSLTSAPRSSGPRRHTDIAKARYCDDDRTRSRRRPASGHDGGSTR